MVPHADWQASGKGCWKMDLDGVFQVTMFAAEPRLFIELEIRDAGRVDYACQWFEVTGEVAVVLLAASREEIRELLFEPLNIVLWKPCDKRTNMTIDELLDLAQKHGHEQGSVDEIADLQYLCVTMWDLLSEEQREKVRRSEFVQELKTLTQKGDDDGRD